MLISILLLTLECPVSAYVPHSLISQPKNTTVSKSPPGAPGDPILYNWHMLLHACAHIQV